MARAFYNYTITVLEKVSFDSALFKKEFEKAYISLLPHERLELKIWLKNFLIKNPDLKHYLTNAKTFKGQKLVKVL